MSGISRQQRIHRQKNRNLISHHPIFLIKILKKPAKTFLCQYLKLYVDQRNVTKGEKNFNPVADYVKMTSRLNSDNVICGVLEDDYRLPEEESSEKKE